jgi:mannose-6-phosphate isomerase-like protein (cupin superfamily)
MANNKTLVSFQGTFSNAIQVCIEGVIEIMPDKPYREVITIHGTNVTLEQGASPIENLGVVGGQEMFKHVNFLDPKFRPENYNKADGAPLRMFDSDSVKIDLSKRSIEDMGFWHRNVDYNEIIFCFRGALRWETEMGTVTLHAGEMILIPKGISHRSMLCDESEEENMLLELKVRDELTYVGDGDAAKG